MQSFEKNKELLDRELRVSPLAAQTYSKSYRYFVKGYAPSFVDHGEGCYLYDVDGNKFIDFICALGPITVGYNEPSINEAVIEQVKKGSSSFSLQSELEMELAEKICQVVPCAEMVRFVKNGGDATTAAVRLARAYTGKDIILMCDGGYHGMHDWSVGTSENHRGVPEAVRALTKTYTYNDIEDLEQKLNENEGQVAAVIMEPIQANGPKEGFLDAAKEAAHKHGALLVFDEVVSGFRYALGGASEYYHVVPDLAAFGKGMGNGYAISAVAGRADVMKLIEEGIFISTTFGGDAVPIAAALETIKILEKPGTYEKIWQVGGMMKSGLEKLIHKHNLEDVISVSGLAPHCGPSFEGHGSLSYLDVQSVYSNVMIQNGMLVFAIWNLNTKHGEKEAEAYLCATDKALVAVREAIDADSIEGFVPGGKGNCVNPVFKRNIK